MELNDSFLASFSVDCVWKFDIFVNKLESLPKTLTQQLKPSNKFVQDACFLFN